MPLFPDPSLIRAAQGPHSALCSSLSNGSFSVAETDVVQVFRPVNASALSQSNRNTRPLLPPPNRANTHLPVSFSRDTKLPNNTAWLMNFAQTTFVVENAHYIPTNQLFPYTVMLVGRLFFGMTIELVLGICRKRVTDTAFIACLIAFLYSI